LLLLLLVVVHHWLLLLQVYCLCVILAGNDWLIDSSTYSSTGW
jgi:hypothetical protein